MSWGRLGTWSSLQTMSQEVKYTCCSLRKLWIHDGRACTQFPSVLYFYGYDWRNITVYLWPSDLRKDQLLQYCSKSFCIDGGKTSRWDRSCTLFSGKDNHVCRCQCSCNSWDPQEKCDRSCTSFPSNAKLVSIRQWSRNSWEPHAKFVNSSFLVYYGL